MIWSNNIKNFDGIDINIYISCSNEPPNEVYERLIENDGIVKLADMGGDSIDTVIFEKTIGDVVTDSNVSFSDACVMTLLKLDEEIQQKYPGVIPIYGMIDISIMNYLDHGNDRYYDDNGHETMWINIDCNKNMNKEGVVTCKALYENVINSLRHGENKYKF